MEYTTKAGHLNKIEENVSWNIRISVTVLFHTDNHAITSSQFFAGHMRFLTPNRVMNH